MRAALLTKHKSVALVNNFADPGKTSHELELSGAINLKSLLEQSDLIKEDEMVLRNNRNDNTFMLGKSFRIVLDFMNVNCFTFKFV